MKKVIAVALFLILSSTYGMAQMRKVQNRPYIDYRVLHYGFFFGMHIQDLELTNNAFVTEDGEMWFADVASYTPNFSVGVLADFLLTPYLSLRIIPTMHFGEKTITFREQQTGTTEKQIMKSTYISLPIDIKYSAQRFNNYRPYLIAGINPMFDLTNKKQKQLLTERLDLMLEVGFGCDFYLPFFKFIPELKFCFSIRDILIKERTDLIDMSYLKFTESVESVQSKLIVLSFYFE